MVALAQYLTREPQAMSPGAILAIWGAAGGAVVAAIVALTGAGALLGWMGIGLILFAAQSAPIVGLAAIAFMPLLPRPRRSLALGIGVSIVTAILVTVLVRAR